MLPGSQAFSLSGGLTAEKGANCMSATGGVTRRFFCGMEQKTLASTKIGRCMDIALDLMINEEIRDREVRLIDENGEQLGVMPTAKAMELAEERGLDLAKIQPTAKPPVCKIIDYGKYRYEQARKAKEAKKKQKTIETKEIRLSPNIDTNDLNTKVNQAKKFLQGGDKLKVSVRFRKRAIAHPQIGEELLKRFQEACKEVGVVDKPAKMEGRSMVMFISPKASK